MNVNFIKRVNRERVINMQKFINELKKMRGIIPKNTIKTLKGQALSGDIDGAKRGLAKVIRK